MSVNINGFKSISELKWYLYRSDAKLRMLYPQIAPRRGVKKTVEWGFSGGIGSTMLGGVSGSISRKVETEQAVDADDMLKAVIQELEDAGQVGTAYEPNLYIKGIMPMRWGFYGDLGSRAPGDGPLVYFGGLDPEQGILVGLGGSSKHVMGHQGATSTYSASCTPALVRALLRGI